jgi:hypothetical protein
VKLDVNSHFVSAWGKKIQMKKGGRQSDAWNGAWCQQPQRNKLAQLPCCHCSSSEALTIC